MGDLEGGVLHGRALLLLAAHGPHQGIVLRQDVVVALRELGQVVAGGGHRGDLEALVQEQRVHLLGDPFLRQLPLDVVVRGARGPQVGHGVDEAPDGMPGIGEEAPVGHRGTGPPPPAAARSGPSPPP